MTYQQMKSAITQECSNKNGDYVMTVELIQGEYGSVVTFNITGINLEDFKSTEGATETSNKKKAQTLKL